MRACLFLLSARPYISHTVEHVFVFLKRACRQVFDLKSERVWYLEKMECVSGDRLASALAMRRGELWDTNFRLAERIEMRIKDAQRAHRQAHGTTSDALRCLLEQHPELSAQ